MPRRAQRRKAAGVKKRAVCPLCGSHDVIPIVYGNPDLETQRALRRGDAILNTCQEWEGLPEWHCRVCRCEWRGGWIIFKRNSSGRRGQS